MEQILVYTEMINQRKIFVFNHIFVQILGLKYFFTTDLMAFTQYQGCKFAYSSNEVNGAIYFPLHPFINQSGIHQQNFEITDYETYKICFALKSGRIFPFDVFSASFYLLSRYEEYLPSNLDHHHRFRAEESFAFKHDFLKLPVIDIWAHTLFESLRKYYPKLKKGEKKFTFIPTIDIDDPFFYQKSKPLKTLKNFIKTCLKREFKFLLTDPFDTYQYIQNLHLKFGYQTLYFILMGNHHQLDTAPNLEKRKSKYKRLIVNLSKNNVLGIHPSYESNKNIIILQSEIDLLSNITNKPITLSRQHYLKLQIPFTYQKLINLGITDDYSMGYASQIGFRASTCMPFFWYDLSTETITSLKIHPFTIMDQTLKTYLKFNTQEAFTESLILLNAVRKVNGTFITLWHNETLGDFGSWKGWQKVYENLLTEAYKTTS